MSYQENFKNMTVRDCARWSDIQSAIKRHPELAQEVTPEELEFLANQPAALGYTKTGELTIDREVLVRWALDNKMPNGVTARDILWRIFRKDQPRLKPDWLE